MDFLSFYFTNNVRGGCFNLKSQETSIISFLRSATKKDTLPLEDSYAGPFNY